MNLDTILGSTDKAEEIIWIIYGNGVIEDSINSFRPEIILSKDTQYVISSTLQTSKGCIATYVDTITPSLSPKLSISNDSICIFNELRLETNYSGSNYEHYWSFSNLNYSNTNSIEVTFSETGTIDFELSVLDKSNSCSDTSRFQVYVGKSIESTIQSSVLCRDQLNEIKAEIFLDSLDEIKDISWFIQGGIISKGAAAFIESDKNEFVGLTIESEFGCIFSNDYPLTLDTLSNPTIEISKTIGKIPFETEVKAEVNDSSSLYHVFLGDTFLTNNINLLIESEGIFDITTVFKNKNQCTYFSSTRLIGYDATPDLGISNITLEKTINQTLLNIEFFNNSNIEIQNFGFEVYLENGNRINFLETEQILPGEQLLFQTAVVSNSLENDPLYCANILTVNGDDDEITTNNYLCSDNRARLHVYPNPFLDGIFLRFDTEIESDINYVIYSVNGTAVIEGIIGTEHFNPEYFLSLSNLGSGEYNLIIKNEEFEVSHKIIKL